MKNNLAKIALIVGAILLIPVFGNLFVEGWDWGVEDFLVMGALLFMTGLAIDVVNQKLVNPVDKFVPIVTLIIIFLAIWVELAVDGVSQLLNILLT